MSDTGLVRGLCSHALLRGYRAARTVGKVQLGVLTTQGEGDT